MEKVGCARWVQVVAACRGSFGVEGQALGRCVSGGACLVLALMGGGGSADGGYSKLFSVV